MPDQVKRVTTQSFISRLTNSVAGIAGGFAMVVAAIAGLVWNEHRAVTTARALDEGAGSVVVLDENGYAPDVNDTNANSDFLDTTGMLVWVHGTLAGDPPTDYDLMGSAFSVPENATRITRVVEMYQWVETQKSESRDKLGGGKETVTTYSYSKDWAPRAVNSGNFAEPTGHQNPPLPVEGETYTEDKYLQVGESEWKLTAEQVGQLGKETTLPLSEADVEQLSRALGTDRTARLSQGAAFFGYDPARPNVGDFRISYRVATADDASVVASDQMPDLVPWTSSNGHEIFLIAEGKVPAEAMFASEKEANVLLTWGLRAAGFAAMLAGFSGMFRVFSVLAGIIPPLGALVRMGTGLLAFVLTLVIAPLTIGLAWLAVRPLLGAAIIVLGIGLAFAFGLLGRRRTPAATAA